MASPPDRFVTRYEIQRPDIIRKDILDPIDYHYKGTRDVDIVIRQPEFTSVCPMTGLPDFGRIIIHYRPKNKIVELKSLKFYLLQYRNVGIFYEHAVNRILEDLKSVLDPKLIEITGEFTSRGGMDARVTAAFPEGTGNPMIERRKAPRTATSYPVFFVCLKEDGRETTQDAATIVNISDSGLLLEASVPILTKEIKIMASLKNSKTVEVLAELIYSMRLAPHTVRSGLSFKGDVDSIRRFVAGIAGTKDLA